ncbi:MAG: hypothetical protein K0R54_644 [Clostridiaceae bacterium]|jgi:hypothetical protein|nr:hypothetical protein [Clostridiaceae bacterium]
MDYINKNSPKYCLHGHQHINKISKYNETYIIGVYVGVILDTKNGEISAIMHID